MPAKSKRLTVLSDAEPFALCGLPEFHDGQQLEYLSLSEAEPVLASSRPGLHAQVYCALQIGYFKAKHAFFRFTWEDAENDCAFVLTRYVNDQAFEPRAITKHKHYTQYPARPARTAVPNCEGVASQVGDLTTESQLLRERCATTPA